MTKGKITGVVILGIIAISGILFINTCMITKIPDRITRVNEFEPIKAYKFYYRSDGSYYFMEEYNVIPEQPLSIFFKDSMFWPTLNTDIISMWGDLFLENKYRILYIKEISYNYNGENNILVKNKRIDIPMDKYDILLDENREPAIIDGKYLYAVRLPPGYFLNWGEEIEFDLAPKHFGQEKEIELIYIYSFDNKNWHEEKYKYKVICGGKKFDINRLHLNFAGIFL